MYASAKRADHRAVFAAELASNYDTVDTVSSRTAVETARAESCVSDTFGKLLRSAGYQTPYTGKWHVSVPQQDKGGLENYGFDFFIYYDPTGDNLQGTYGDEIRGYHNDSYSAGQGVDWLLNKRPTDQPWCLTVSLINPHDREFFPAGTEFKTVTNLFADNNVNPKGLQQLVDYPGTGPDVSWQENALKRPPTYKYSDCDKSKGDYDTGVHKRISAGRVGAASRTTHHRTRPRSNSIRIATRSSIWTSAW